MNHRKTSPAIRMASAFLALLLPAVMLLSSFYLTAEAGHHCPEEDCPICATMELCLHVLQQVGSSVPVIFLRMLPFLSLLMSGLLMLRVLPSVTPVSAKVRLNN